MPVFATTNDPNNTRGQIVTNDGFYPDIQVDDFIEKNRTQDTIADGRLLQVLTTAMMDVNRELKNWQAQQTLAGYTTLNDVPAIQYGNLSELVHLYTVAVYARAKAWLLEKWRDIDTTRPDGNKRANEFENTVNDYEQEARNAISAIMGQNMITVELI